MALIGRSPVAFSTQIASAVTKQSGKVRGLSQLAQAAKTNHPRTLRAFWINSVKHRQSQAL
jgi:hypothetical protein